MKVRGFALTATPWTLIDLAGVVGVDLLELAVDDALRRRLTTILKLMALLQERGTKGRKGSAVLARLIEERSGQNGITESTLETRLLRVMRNAGLPMPELQYEIREGGKLVARVDFAFPTVRLAIEADGFRYHSSPAALARDHMRANRLAELGWLVIRTGWQAVRDHPESVAGEIERCLRARGFWR